MALGKHRMAILDKQFIQARLADIATELFMSSCVYSRISTLLVNGTIPESEKQREIETGMLYMRLARARNQQRFEDLRVNLDEEIEKVADSWLEHEFGDDWVIVPENQDIDH